jgi:hypothetical protein
MKQKQQQIVLIVLLATLSGCSTWRKLNGTEKGAVIGGGSGAVIGDIVAPGVGGAVVGGALGAVGGGLIGHEEDRHRKHK